MLLYLGVHWSFVRLTRPYNTQHIYSTTQFCAVYQTTGDVVILDDVVGSLETENWEETACQHALRLTDYQFSTIENQCARFSACSR